MEAQIQQRPNNIISHIFDAPQQLLRIPTQLGVRNQNQRHFNPQYLRVKNNILLILLVLGCYGIYYMFQGFLTVFIFAFMMGISYQTMKKRFIKFWQSQEPFFHDQYSIIVRILLIVMYAVLIKFLPFINFYFVTSQSPSYEEIINIAKFYLQQGQIDTSFTIKLIQIGFAIQIVSLLLAPKVLPIFAKFIPVNKTFYTYLFGLIFILMIIVSFVIVPSALVMEIKNGQEQIQTNFNCSIFDKSTNQTLSANQTRIPLCSQKWFKNADIQENLRQFMPQQEQIQGCIVYVGQIQKSLPFSLQMNTTYYKQMGCTGFLLAQKGILYFDPQTDMIATSKNILKSLFGNILVALSNYFFQLTTFITIFFLTVEYFDYESKTIKQILKGQNRQLVSQITNLIQATLFIVGEHFILSLVLLQIFGFGNFKFMFSIFLSIMAFAPYFRPYFGALAISLIKSAIFGNILANLLFVIFYWYISENVFDKRLKKMDLHSIITNFSIIFGIYQFGLAGIFYGPLIIIILRCVQRQMLKNQIFTKEQRGPIRSGISQI